MPFDPQFNDLYDARMAASVERREITQLRREFDPRDYNAEFNGVDSDHQGMQDALEDATAEDGVVVLPPGVTALLDDVLEWPVDSHAGLMGNNSIIQAMSSMDRLLHVRSATSGALGRYGVIQDVRLDGNDVARIGLDFLGVQKVIRNVTINRCTKTGFYVNGAQNCTFESINCEDNGTNAANITGMVWPDGNIVLDNGARNNLFNRCQMGARYDDPANRGLWNLVFTMTDHDAPYAAGEPPSFNTFLACQLERTAQSFHGAIYHRAGAYNKLISTLIQTVGNRTLIKMSNEEGEASNNLLVLGCYLSGGGSGVIAAEIDCNTHPAMIIGAGTAINGCTEGFVIADNSSIDIIEPLFHGLNPLARSQVSGTAGGTATGTKAEHALMVNRMFSLPSAPDNTIGAPASIYNNTVPSLFDNLNHMHWVFAGGTWRFNRFRSKFPVATLAYNGGSVAVNMQNGDWQRLILAPGETAAITIGVPSNAIAGMKLRVDIGNFTGGTMGNITFSASAGGFLLNSALTKPGNGAMHTLICEFDGTQWVEASRHPWP